MAPDALPWESFGARWGEHVRPIVSLLYCSFYSRFIVFIRQSKPVTATQRGFSI
jgi:hypothetical protein